VTKILVFGESPNDTNALKILILGLCPALKSSDVRVLRAPPTLQRDAHQLAVKQWVDRAASALRAARIVLGEAICIFAHSDSDGPDGCAFEEARTAQLRAAGFSQAHAVIPVESIEAWWLLFPEATEDIVPTWAGALVRKPGDVDRVNDPKSELIRRTRRKQPKRPYREGDSPAIAAAIVAGGHFGKSLGTSESFGRFLQMVMNCCELLGTPATGSSTA